MGWRFGLGLILVGLCGGMVWEPAIAATTAEDYRILGLAYRQQGQFEEAIAAMQTAVDLAPDHVSGQVLLGWTQHLADQDTAAAETLVNAWQLDPFAVSTANALGIVYLVQNRLWSAIATHLWAAYLQPDNEIAYFNLSLAAHGVGYYDWAIALAAKAVVLEPYNPHPLIAEAIAHWSKGDRSAAIERYRAAVSLSFSYATVNVGTYLDRAAFSSRQIQLAQQIIAAL
ncbi:MAG: tetratricopeptide repeat protein [Cyanothece sp. SIO2G6]|nr:tetratricopeptide repeat protein [Cyanothece sp. SIO2G6]